jgi:hypothetical protein
VHKSKTQWGKFKLIKKNSAGGERQPHGIVLRRSWQSIDQEKYPKPSFTHIGPHHYRGMATTATTHVRAPLPQAGALPLFSRVASKGHFLFCATRV